MTHNLLSAHLDSIHGSDKKEYANILNALNAGTTTLPSANSTMEDINRKTENYKLVDKLNNEGISLKDLLNQIDELKKKVEGMEAPRENIDAGVFLAMESAVENDPEVSRQGSIWTS